MTVLAYWVGFTVTALLDRTWTTAAVGASLAYWSAVGLLAYLEEER